jgi:hypothetical protein
MTDHVGYCVELPASASSSADGATAPNPNATSASRRTNRTRWAISADKNSVQSRFSSMFTEPLPPKALDARDALLEREGRDVLLVHRTGFVEALRHPQDALDHDVLG